MNRVSWPCVREVNILKAIGSGGVALDCNRLSVPTFLPLHVKAEDNEIYITGLGPCTRLYNKTCNLIKLMLHKKHEKHKIKCTECSPMILVECVGKQARRTYLMPTLRLINSLDSFSFL